MTIDPSAIGAVTEPKLYEWTDRDTPLLCARGRGRHRRPGLHHGEQPRHPQQVFADVCGDLLHGLRRRAARRLLQLGQAAARLAGSPPFGAAATAGALSVVAEVADIQDKGEGKNAIIMLRAVANDPATGRRSPRRHHPGDPRRRRIEPARPAQGRPLEFSDREPDARIALPTREGRALLYRLPATAITSSDPWFAQTWLVPPSRSCTGCAPTVSRARTAGRTSPAATPRS